MKILLGFYYGVGDFISSIPIIRELSKRYDVTTALGNHNKGLIELVDIGNSKVIFFPLFSLSKMKIIINFISELKKERFDKILVSPHAQDKVTSWKIPLMLKYIKSLNTEIVGAFGDKNSFLYDRKIPIDKSLPLMKREIEFVKLVGLINYDKKIYVNDLFKVKRKRSENIVVIHPGASKKLRRWKLEYYIDLVNILINRTGFNVIFIGLEKELYDLKKNILHKRVKFFSGEFKDVIDLSLKSKCIITMDSGFGHIASSLGLNHIMLVGSANPNFIRPIYKNTKILNIKKLSCQPCNGHICHIGHNYCMDLITPKIVYTEIVKSIKKGKKM